jgi:hypothetical protein
MMIRRGSHFVDVLGGHVSVPPPPPCPHIEHVCSVSDMLWEGTIETVSLQLWKSMTHMPIYGGQ